MKPRAHIPTLTLSALALVTGLAGAQQATTRPAATAAPATQPAGALEATVVSVKGDVQKMRVGGATEQWTPVKAGEKLDEMTVVRTGLRSEAVVRFADRGETIVGAGTKFGIAEFRKTGGLVTTRLGLKYGSLNVAVDSTPGPNDASVATPVATLSVRGTAGKIGYTGGSRLRLKGSAGTWQVAQAGRSRNVSAGQSTDGNLTPSITLVKGGRDSLMAVVGLTPIELINVIDNPSPISPTTPTVGPGSGPETTNNPVFVPPDHILPP
jgi:hypothetical protein